MNSKSTLFLLSWDQLGLEACINVTQLEKEQVWDKLQGKKLPNILGSTTAQLVLRARYNPQRHYEIYSIWVDSVITERDIRDMFEETPQESADLIRTRGNKIFSDRAQPSEIKIT